MTGPTLPAWQPATGEYTYRRYCPHCTAMILPAAAGRRQHCPTCGRPFLGLARSGEARVDGDVVFLRLVEYLDVPGRLFLRAYQTALSRSMLAAMVIDHRRVMDHTWRRLDDNLDMAYYPDCGWPGCRRVGRLRFNADAAAGGSTVGGRWHLAGTRIDLCHEHGSVLYRESGVPPAALFGHPEAEPR